MKLPSFRQLIFGSVTAALIGGLWFAHATRLDRIKESLPPGYEAVVVKVQPEMTIMGNVSWPGSHVDLLQNVRGSGDNCGTGIVLEDLLVLDYDVGRLNSAVWHPLTRCLELLGVDYSAASNVFCLVTLAVTPEDAKTIANASEIPGTFVVMLRPVGKPKGQRKCTVTFQDVIDCSDAPMDAAAELEIPPPALPKLDDRQ